MMETIITIDQHELGLFTDDDKEIISRRMAARAVMKNENGQIALMHFAKVKTYKLPGGGRDDGETMLETLDREMREETGYTIKNVRELGLVEEYRHIIGEHQTSYVYMADCDSYVGTDLTASEQSYGVELVWVDSYEDAIERIHSASELDHRGSIVGLQLMKMRETAILKFARQAEL